MIDACATWTQPNPLGASGPPALGEPDGGTRIAYGLLPEPARSAAGYRLYDQDAVARLRLIRGARRAGLRLREIGELLQVADQGLCPEPQPVAAAAAWWCAPECADPCPPSEGR